MSTAIPSQFSFEMLSRLPPQSFELQYREYRPDVEPNGGVYPISQDSKLTFHLRGAPNEVILNSNLHLQASVGLTVQFPAAPPYGGTNAQAIAALFNSPTALKWRKGATWISASRESFNSGALPYLDNQDTKLHLVHNNLRSKMAKRYYDGDRVQDLWGAGQVSSSNGINAIATMGTDGEYIFRNEPAKVSIPLGYYSSLVNTHSVIPVGLMSSYSVNGWSIEVTLPNLVKPGADPNCPIDTSDLLNNGRGAGLDNGTIVNYQGKDAYRDVRIMVPIIKILDPAVMQAILSLYEKQETVNVGGMAFPMSLRLNSLNYRFFQFPLSMNQGDYYFRLPSTDRSVRAAAFTIVDRTATFSDSTGAGLVVTRLSTRVGSRVVHEPVEDRSPYTANVPHFLALSERRSSALFSPFPYWQDAIRHQAHQSDERKADSWAPWRYDTGKNNQQYGVISLENLDHREPEYSGSFQASGMDLTNVGAVEIDFRVSTLTGTTDVLTANYADMTYAPGPVNNNYVVCWMLAYDCIHEVSPSGVIEITNSVL